MRIKTFFRHGHNIEALRNFFLIKPEKLPEQALYPVALHCSANLSAYRYAKAPAFKPGRQYKKNKARCKVAFSVTITP